MVPDLVNMFAVRSSTNHLKRIAICPRTLISDFGIIKAHKTKTQIYKTKIPKMVAVPVLETCGTARNAPTI